MLTPRAARPHVSNSSLRACLSSAHIASLPAHRLPGLPVPIFLIAHCVPFICPHCFSSCPPRACPHISNRLLRALHLPKSLLFLPTACICPNFSNPSVCAFHLPKSLLFLPTACLCPHISNRSLRAFHLSKSLLFLLTACLCPHISNSSLACLSSAHTDSFPVCCTAGLPVPTFLQPQSIWPACLPCLYTSSGCPLSACLPVHIVEHWTEILYIGLNMGNF